MSRHAAVWIDHHEAKIFHIEGDEAHTNVVPAPRQHVRRHSSQTAERAHPADAKKFYEEVAQAIRDDAEVLVVGPGSAKLELIKHVHEHDAAIAKKIVGVETVDHPTDGQLLKYARTYFKAADRMH